MLKQKSNQPGGSSQAAIQSSTDKQREEREKNERQHTTSELK